MKYVTDEAMGTGMALQKGYIDDGDKANAEALDAAKSELQEDIKVVSDKVDLLQLSAQYFVAKYSKGTNDYTEISHLGQKDILNKFGFVLLDTTDNANITTKAKRLKDNNLFRFEDGSFAPTVGITTDQYNQCMANDVYTENGGTYTKLYDAGAFDAAAYWRKVDKPRIQSGGQAQKLYISDGSGGYQLVTHVLRPWETTETKYTIGIANLVDLYLLDNQEGSSGNYWKGLFLKPIIWDGINLTKRKLPPTAIGPGPFTSIQEGDLIKTRNFFYLYRGIGRCKSSPGLLPNRDFYEADRTYPRVGDINQISNVNMVRINNADPSKPYPFAEGGYFATNVFITALELAAGTRYIHQANLFGSGISSNDGCNAENFFTSGGVRLKKVGDDDWQYKTFDGDSSPLQYNVNGSTSDLSNVLTQYWPKEQCMESQMAASMATELGIKPTIDSDNIHYFQFYGNTYYYMNVPGFDGLQEGKMNARVYKYIQKTVSAFADKAPADFDVEVIQRMSLFNGANLCGDIWAYNGGGLEMVGTKSARVDISLPIDIYIEPDQTKWHSETGTIISNSKTFGFEALYEKVISTTNIGNSYTLTRGGYTPFKTAKASTMAQGECYFQFDVGVWANVGQRARIMSVFRGHANAADCSPRYLDSRRDISFVFGYIAGSSQALIEL